MMSDMTKPVMALNPYTNKLINVEPLFRFIREHNDGSNLVDDLIRHLIINQNHELTDYLFEHFQGTQGMFLYLYDLRQFFKEITECQISMPKKGGEA